MSIASRGGKLYVGGGGDDPNSCHRREDLLTSDVFGAYRYLPVQAGIGPLLAGAVDADGSTLASWAAKHDVPWDTLSVAWFAFWPSLAGREPDLVVVLGDANGEAKLAVLVEVKLHAQQHFIEGLSQLGHYGLTFRDGELDDEPFDVALPPLRPVVYVTVGTECPTGELRAARDEIGVSDSARETGVFWTSWSAAAVCAEDARIERGKEDAAAHELALLDDLVADLAHRGFHRPRAIQSFPLPPLPTLGHYALAAHGLRSTKALAPRTFADLDGLELPMLDGALRRWRMR